MLTFSDVNGDAHCPKSSFGNRRERNRFTDPIDLPTPNETELLLVTGRMALHRGAAPRVHFVALGNFKLIPQPRTRHRIFGAGKPTIKSRRMNRGLPTPVSLGKGYLRFPHQTVGMA